MLGDINGFVPAISDDARQVLNAIAEGEASGGTGDDWDAPRVASAAAEAAASVLHTIDASIEELVEAFRGVGALPQRGETGAVFDR